MDIPGYDFIDCRYMATISSRPWGTLPKLKARAEYRSFRL
jgi:hypothetical protein